MKRHRSESGQMTIEGILLMTLLLAGASAAAGAFKSQSLLQTLAVGPWSYVRGMTENGVWSPILKNPSHPNVRERHGTVIGDTDNV